LSAEGWQEESYEETELDRRTRSSRRRHPTASRSSPPSTARRSLGARRCLSASEGSGACKLYLLDTDLEENAPWDRELSARRYGGDRERAVQQEIILGSGGVRRVKLSGVTPGALSS
jgi:starch phosphorylase